MTNFKKQETRNKQISNSKFKAWRVVLIIVVCVGFVGFLAVGYWYKTEGPAMAVDYNTNTEIVCEEPIPVGIAIDTTVDFLDQIYQKYQGDEVKTASKAVDDLMIAIANQDGKVCDFNTECKAQVGTGGPDASIGGEVALGIGQTRRLTYTVPSCKLKEATGNPCPDLSSYVGEQTPAEWAANLKLLSLDGLANSLTSQADNIHGMFAVADTPVPYGLGKPDETVGETMITKADLVKRYIADIDSWLTPNPQKNTCALSELDRQRIAQGKMGDKYPMQCLEALHQNMYMPKAWSEECQDECQTFTQECKNCLAKCNGTSVYASLNCKIYSTGEGQKAVNTECNKNLTEDTCVDGCTWGKQFSISLEDTCYTIPQTAIGTNPKCAFIPGQSKKCCGAVCADGFNTQCKECLCAGEDPQKPLSQDQCLDWICGGSRANWVCCHEEPIQNPAWYTYDQIFATINVMETIKNPDGTFTNRIVTKDDKFGNAYGIFVGLWGKYPSLNDMNIAFVMANTYRESKLNNALGSCFLFKPLEQAQEEGNSNNGDYTLRQVIKLWPDKKHKRAFYRDGLVILQNIVNVLNFDLYSVPMSCPDRSGGDSNSHGGAIGPAQFIPTTWNDYAGRVKVLTGAEANPWSEEDAYLAGALYLQKLKKDNNDSEAEAAKRYCGTGTKADKCSTQTMCIKPILEDQISKGCFEESGKNASCQKNLDSYIRSQCY